MTMTTTTTTTTTTTKHILIDAASPETGWTDAQKTLLQSAASAARAAGADRLTILRRMTTVAETELGQRRASVEDAQQTTGARGDDERALRIVELTAPIRDAVSGVREGQRLGALAAEIGADLLVTWDIAAEDLVIGTAARVRVLLLRHGHRDGDGDSSEERVAGASTAAWPRTPEALGLLFARALAAPARVLSPEHQARLQTAALAAFCAEVKHRDGGAASSAAGASTAVMPGADNRNALVFLLGPRALYRQHLVSAREIVCGPDMETTLVDGRLATLNVPSGQHDFRRLVDWLPADQKPELVIVKADATGRNFPTGLASVKCPKVLLVGDTHHLGTPLRRVMAYAHSEPFDFVVIDHTRHHGHYFVEGGFENVAWLPAFDLSPHDVARDAGAPGDPAIVFVGQVGVFHPYRSHVLATLSGAGLPLRAMRAPPAEAARLYANSRVSLNVSLNGDLNLRVFETLAAGGCLLTDRLSPEAGLESLFCDGEHLSLYDSDASLLARARELLHNPDEARRIARAGHALYAREHTPAARIRALTTWIDGGGLEERWNLQFDRRARTLRSIDATDLNLRLAAYETVQEWHRTHGASGRTLGLVAWPDVDARLLVDLLDLPRLRISIYGESAAFDPVARRLLIEASVWSRLRFVGEANLAFAGAAFAGQPPAGLGAGSARDHDAAAHPSATETFDGLMLSTQAWLSAEPKSLAQLARGRQLLVATRSDAEARLVLGRQPAFAVEGYLAQATPIPSFQQKNPVILGEVAVIEGRLDEALQCFQAALAADPEYVEALNNLGVLAQQADDRETAASFLERAIRLDRAHVPALINLATLFQDTDHLGESEALLLAATAAQPDHEEAWQQLAQLRHHRGDNLGARDALLRLAAVAPGRADIAEALETLRAASAPTPASHLPSDAATATATATLAAGPPPPLRILVVNNLYPPQELGGYGRLMADFASYLVEMGHTVHVLTSNTPYLGAIREPETHVTRTLELYGSWRDGRTEELPKEAAVARARANHATLAAMLDSFQPDVAFIGNIDFVSPHLFAPLLERGIPVLHYLANGLPGFLPADAPQSPHYRPVACSRWLAERLEATYSFRGIGVLHPGARVNDYKMPLPPLRRRLHIAYASLVMPYKGPHVLMSALEELGRRRVDFTCSIAGHSTDPTFLAHLDARARTAELRGRVQFLGFLERTKLRGLFARSNVLVFPSVFDEPFGISQVEAMAAGLTVITSGTGGACEIVEHEQSGLVFPSENSESLADALSGLPADPARWERLGDAGQARAFACFDMRRLADNLERELRALVAQSPRERGPVTRGKALPVLRQARPPLQ